MSNSPSNIEKFSLKAFQNRKTKVQKDQSHSTKAERKPTRTNLTRQLIALGDDATSRKATVANSAIAAILNIYKHNTNIELYIKPGSAWVYNDRFAVLWVQPPHIQITPTKEEIKAALVNFEPRQLDLISLGYSTVFQYIPRPTSPDKLVYLLLAQDLSKEHFSHFMRYKGKVRVPPQLPNMLNKLRVNLSQVVKPPPVGVLKEVIKLSSCEIPVLTLMFQDLEKEKAGCVKAMMTFITSAQPHPASPGFPWTSMAKPDGTSWGSLSVTNEPLLQEIMEVIERFIKILNGSIGTTEETRSKMSRKEAFVKGKRLYEKLYMKNYKSFVIDKVITGQKLTDPSVDYLSPHIIYTQSAGNVKPVTSDEIGEGKPDRSIFQSPSMIRIAYMYLSSLVGEHWKNPSKLSNFGWQKGGAEKVVNALFQQIGFKENQFIEVMDYLPKQEGMNVHDITFSKAMFCAPDIKAQDNHFHEEVFSVLYEVLDKDIVSKLPKIYQNIFSAYLGFMSACDEKPLVMTNNSIIYTPKHLNASGGPFTTAHSNNHSNMIRVELMKFDFGPGIKIAHLASGDDAIVMFYSTTDTHFGYHGVRDIARSKLEKDHNTITQSNGFVQEHATKFQFGHIKRFAQHIKKNYSIELKPETLELFPTLTAVQYLGNHIYYMDEKAYGSMALIPSRPLDKILFTILWGSTAPTAGVSLHMIAAMRLLSSYYDASLIYGDIHIALSKIYAKLRKLEANKPMPSRKFMETDFMDLPDELGSTLPDLPTMSEIFTWMTGLEVTDQFSENTVEGEEEFVSYDEDEEVLKRPKAQDIKKKLEKQLSEEDEFVSFDEKETIEEKNKGDKSYVKQQKDTLSEEEEELIEKYIQTSLEAQKKYINKYKLNSKDKPQEDLDESDSSSEEKPKKTKNKMSKSQLKRFEKKSS